MAALNEIYGEMELIAKIGKQCAEIEDVSPKVQKDLLIEMAIQPIFVASYRAKTRSLRALSVCRISRVIFPFIVRNGGGSRR